MRWNLTEVTKPSLVRLHCSRSSEIRTLQSSAQESHTRISQILRLIEPFLWPWKTNKCFLSSNVKSVIQHFTNAQESIPELFFARVISTGFRASNLSNETRTQRNFRLSAENLSLRLIILLLLFFLEYILWKISTTKNTFTSLRRSHFE